MARAAEPTASSSQRISLPMRKAATARAVEPTAPSLECFLESISVIFGGYYRAELSHGRILTRLIDVSLLD